MVELDLIDRRVLCELDLNCRAPLSILARKLRISRSVLAYRINRLVKEGIIEKFICSLDLGKLGYKTYKVYIKISSIKAGDEKELAKYLYDKKNIIHLLKTDVFYDYSFAIAVKNLGELDEFIVELKTKFNHLIKDYYISTLIYTRIFKLEKFLLDKKQNPVKMLKYTNETDMIEIDEKDKIILKVLSQEANLPVTEISKKTGMSIDIVKYRIRKLSKSVVNSYRIHYNISKSGYFHYVFLIRMRQATKQDEERLITWCGYKNNVFYCTKRIGEFDFEINVAIKDINEMNQFVNELKSEFGGAIDDYAFLLNSKVLKLNYVPF